jgi:acyl-CoA thioesterase-1
MRAHAFLPLVSLALLASGCSGQKAPEPLERRSDAPQASSSVVDDAPVILAFGDSLYAGYQLDQGQGYPPRLEAAMRAGGIAVVNAGVSGDTTAAALGRWPSRSTTSRSSRRW